LRGAKRRGNLTVCLMQRLPLGRELGAERLRSLQSLAITIGETVRM